MLGKYHLEFHKHHVPLHQKDLQYPPQILFLYPFHYLYPHFLQDFVKLNSLQKFEDLVLDAFVHCIGFEVLLWDQIVGWYVKHPIHLLVFPD